MRTLTVGVALVALVLAGCGEDEPPPEPEPTATAPQGDPLPDGTAVPAALSELRCAESDGAWSATGLISNDDKTAADYQVIAYVGVRDGQPHEARTETLARIQPGGSARFTIEDISRQGDDSTCHVQVWRLDG